MKEFPLKLNLRSVTEDLPMHHGIDIWVFHKRHKKTYQRVYSFSLPNILENQG